MLLMSSTKCLSGKGRRQSALLLVAVALTAACVQLPLVSPKPVADETASSCGGARPAIGGADGWSTRTGLDLPSNGAIIAERFDPIGDERASIVRVDAHTGAERQILTLESYQDPFSVSPDAKSIAVVDTGRSGAVWGTELKMASIDGGNIRPAYSADEYVRGLAWSPDSASLAFLADDRIYRLELADLKVTEIGDAPTNAHSQGYREMRWSQDGRWLAFSGENYQAIHLVPSDGSREPILFGEGYGFDWSPEGAELAFVHFEGLSAAQADGTGLRDLIVEDPEFPLVEAPWRPDGEAIAVSIGEWSPGEVCILLADGGLQSVAGYVDLEGNGLDWSPDGTRLLFRMVGELPDGAARPLATVGGSGGEVQTLGGDLLHPQWIPAE